MEPEKVSLPTESEKTVETPLDARDVGFPKNPTTSNGGQIPESDSDNSWENQLVTLKQKIEEMQERYEQSYLEIGKALIQARDVYKGHGNWIEWLKENVPFSVRHAQRLIRVAEMLDNATPVSQPGLTSSKAYILTRIGKENINHFLNDLRLVEGNPKSIQDMTKRELESVVTSYLKERLASANCKETVANQGGETSKESFESNLEKLRDVLSRTIASIKASDSSVREAWIAKLEDLCNTGLDQLASAPE